MEKRSLLSDDSLAKNENEKITETNDSTTTTTTTTAATTNTNTTAEAKNITGSTWSGESKDTNNNNNNNNNNRSNQIQRSYELQPPKHSLTELHDTGKGCSIRWTDICLDVPDPSNKGQMKPILRGQSGQARAGELMGILGASGGGKTSLLAILSGRIKALESLATSKSQMSGFVELKGKRVNVSENYALEYLRTNVAYVLQEDLLFATEKTREAIEASALLRLPQQLSTEEKLEMAHEVMHQLDLTHVSETYIGSQSIRGLSGGERKRVSIGVELVTNPPVLFLDEPTSGLDSAIAYQTIKLLKSLAEQGKTVVASLHQPSGEILGLLDRLMILARGQVIYEGKMSEVSTYFESIGFKCPLYSNIADYVLQQVNNNVDTFIEEWKKYSEGKNTQRRLERQQSLPVTESMVVSEKRQMASVRTQLYIISARSFKIFIRDPLPTYVRFGQVIFAGILEGFLWFQITDLEGIEDINTATVNAQNRFGGIFYAIASCCMNAIMAANLTFPSQRLVFQKERASNWYYTWVWVLCKILIDTPVSCLAMLPFTIMIKYMVNFRADLMDIYLALILCAMVADSLGFFLGTIANRPELAIQISPITIVPLMLFSNFFVATNTIPVYLRWVKWVDPFFYGTEIFSIDEFRGIPIGEELLDNYSIEPKNKWRDVALMLALFCGLRSIGIISLLWRNGL